MVVLHEHTNRACLSGLNQTVALPPLNSRRSHCAARRIQSGKKPDHQAPVGLRPPISLSSLSPLSLSLSSPSLHSPPSFPAPLSPSPPLLLPLPHPSIFQQHRCLPSVSAGAASLLGASLQPWLRSCLSASFCSAPPPGRHWRLVRAVTAGLFSRSRAGREEAQRRQLPHASAEVRRGKRERLCSAARSC